MRFDHITIEGLGPFRERVELDLAAIEGRVVAVTGANGAGKSSLLELLAGGIYRTCPTRGALSDLATTRGSFVEVAFTNGASHTIRQTVDAISRKGETLITDAGGRPVIESGKLRDADEWIAEHLPRPDVLYASSFAPQGSGGFLELRPADRKSVLLTMLGIARIEKAAEAARERRKAASERTAIARARAEEHWRRPHDVEAASRELEQSADALKAADERHVAAERELEALRAQATAAAAAWERHREAERRNAELVRAIEEERIRVDAVVGELGQAQTALSEQPAVEAAVARLAALTKELAPIETKLRAAKDAAAARVSEVSDLEHRITRELEDGAKLAKRKGPLEAVLAGAAVAEKAAGALPGLAAARDTAIDALNAARDAVSNLNQTGLAGAGERIEGLRLALGAIAEPAPGTDSRATARLALTVDDALVNTAASFPGRLAAATDTWRKAEAAMREAESQHNAAVRAAAQADGIARARAELEELATALERSVKTVAHMHAKLTDAKTAAVAARAVVDTLTEEAWQLDHEADELRATAAKLPAVHAAAARVTALEQRAAELRERVVALTKQRADLPVTLTPDPPPDTSAAIAAAQAAQSALAAAQRRHTLAESALAAAHETAQALAKLEAEVADADREVSDWTLLATALGRDGVQAYEIDAVGPELSSLATELLHAAFGSRWTVSFETTRISADGKKTIEDFEVRVLDTERGTDGPADRLSGGERVIVGEAVSLALTVVACRRAGIEAPTLVRDESGAALDAANGAAYVAMLRKAADIIGAQQTLIVTHSAAMAELCDARIVVDAGRVTVTA